MDEYRSTPTADRPVTPPGPPGSPPGHGYATEWCLADDPCDLQPARGDQPDDEGGDSRHRADEAGDPFVDLVAGTEPAGRAGSLPTATAA